MARRIRHRWRARRRCVRHARLDSLARFLAVGGGSELGHDHHARRRRRCRAGARRRRHRSRSDAQVCDAATVAAAADAGLRSRRRAADATVRAAGRVSARGLPRRGCCSSGSPRNGSAFATSRSGEFLALFGAIGLGGALFLAALVASRIADPLRKLTADAARLGAGDLGARTNVRAPGEVGTLAATFNQMAGTLQDAHRRARRERRATPPRRARHERRHLGLGHPHQRRRVE